MLRLAHFQISLPAVNIVPKVNDPDLIFELIVLNMAMNNEFLGLVHPADGNRYIEDCFCATCRNLRVVSYTQLSIPDLHRVFSRTLPSEQDEHLFAYHRAVLDQIAAGKTFKNLALHNDEFRVENRTTNKNEDQS